MKVIYGQEIVLSFLGSMDDSPYLCAVEDAETGRKLARGNIKYRSSDNPDQKKTQAIGSQ